MDTPPTPKFTLEGKDLLDHLAERAAQTARAELLAREERRNRTIATVIALLGLVGVGAVMGGLKLLVAQEMEQIQQDVDEVQAYYETRIDAQLERLSESTRSEVRAEVLAELGKELGDVKRQLALNSQFEEYSELAGQLIEQLSGVHRAHDRYVATVLAESMAAIRAVAAQPELTSRSRFIVVTRQIVDVLVRFNRVAEIDELDTLLGDVLRTDPELTKALADHYGQLVIGSPLPLSEQAEHVARLETYAEAAAHTLHAEKQLVWQLFLEFKRNDFRRSAATDGLLESSQDLPPANREQFWFDLCKYSDPTLWLLEPDQQGRQMQRLMEALVQHYPIVQRMMQQTVADNPAIQQNIAERRLRTRAIMATAGRPDAAPTAEDESSAVDAASAGSNLLRQ
ncbi:MAG: hypothetical protein KDA44_16780 [Planctomycetales bacterium]|nr:hypothetical protein [Planctomycetales bacterium]